jgi:uncharacterized membrane protein YedE/YeeE
VKGAVTSFLCGSLFGLGLALSGMTDTRRVLGFLDIWGAWDPALLLVMGGAVVVTLVSFRRVLRRAHPLFADAFHLPQNRQIDLRLLSGAAIFGIGWGVYGYCPGPALSALTYGHQGTMLFVGAMVAGMWLASLVKPRPIGQGISSPTS